MKNSNKKKLGILALISMVAALLAGCKFKASDNEAVAIYGPPEMFEDPATDGVQTEPVSDEFDPEFNREVEIYGPPEMMDERLNSNK